MIDASGAMWKWVLLVALVLQGFRAIAADEPRFKLSEDGAAVIDTQSRLAWSRCAEGAAWRSGACRGEALAVSYNEAASRAKSRANEEGVAWRLPTVHELKSLAERMHGMGARSSVLFPAAPDGWYWTSSVRVETGRVNQYDYTNAQRGLTEKNVNRVGYLHGWVVDVDAARARSDMPRREKVSVRLVRRLPN